jgi:hypothetical protein
VLKEIKESGESKQKIQTYEEIKRELKEQSI